MAEHEERINEIEARLRVNETSVSIIHNDFKQVNRSLSSMAQSMEKLADVQTKLTIMEERCDTRHNNMKEDHKELAKRVDAVEHTTKTVEEDHKSIVNIKTSFWKALGWSAAGLVTGIALAFIMVVYYVAKNGGF